MNPMFYFLLALTAVLAATTNAGTPILDCNGYRVITNTSYYVRPLIHIFEMGGGGLTLSTFGVNICPFYVGQEKSEFENGIPVKLSDWKSGDGFVPESENLNIEMDVKDTLCFEQTYWRISTAPVVPVRLLIKTGPKPSNGLFQIKKSERHRYRYQFVFCPDGYDCTEVGLFVDNQGLLRLALNTTTIYEVAFVKVRKTETLSKTMSII